MYYKIKEEAGSRISELSVLLEHEDKTNMVLKKVLLMARDE